MKLEEIYFLLDEERSVPNEVCHQICWPELEQTAIVFVLTFREPFCFAKRVSGVLFILHCIIVFCVEFSPRHGEGMLNILLMS